MAAAEEVVRYKRSRFATRLPVGRRYTRSHYWLARDDAGLWRVGLTQFATRMLGDLVEYEFAVKPGDRVDVGQTIGWIEGFKAVSDVYAVAEGRFAAANAELDRRITLLETDPYGAGWLYSVDGEAESASLDVQGYVSVLDATIDRMLDSRHQDDPDA